MLYTSPLGSFHTTPLGILHTIHLGHLGHRVTDNLKRCFSFNCYLSCCASYLSMYHYHISRFYFQLAHVVVNIAVCQNMSDVSNLRLVVYVPYLCLFQRTHLRVRIPKVSSHDQSSQRRTDMYHASLESSFRCSVSSSRISDSCIDVHGTEQHSGTLKRLLV